MVDRDGLVSLLEEWRIAHEIVDHAPVLTMAESETLVLPLSGERCKNLLLQDKRGELFLVVTAADQGPLDLKMLRDQIACARLSFARREAMTEMGVPPGGMSPLALVNRSDIGLVMDRRLDDVEAFLFHPLDNAATLRLGAREFEAFVERLGAERRWVDLAG